MFLDKFFGREECPGCEARSEEVSWLRARVERLEEQVIEMRREGFSPTPKIPKGREDSTGRQRLPPAVESAIDEMAGDDEELHAELFSWASNRLQMDQDPEGIVDEIYDGADIQPVKSGVGR